MTSTGVDFSAGAPSGLDEEKAPATRLDNKGVTTRAEDRGAVGEVTAVGVPGDHTERRLKSRHSTYYYHSTWGPFTGGRDKKLTACPRW